MGNAISCACLVGLHLQKTELEQDIGRLQEAQGTSTLNLDAEKSGRLSMEMRKRLAEGPTALRQAYMKLLLEGVTVGHHEVRLEGSSAVLEKLARNGASKSCAEVLSFAQGWRAVVVKRENWHATLDAGSGCASKPRKSMT